MFFYRKNFSDVHSSHEIRELAGVTKTGQSILYLPKVNIFPEAGGKLAQLGEIMRVWVLSYMSLLVL